MPQIEALVREIGDVRAISIDPLTDFAGAVKLFDDASARSQLLRPMIRLARRHRLAWVFTLHMNKKTDLTARQRAQGAGALVNFPRSTLFLGKDPEDKDRRILCQEKANENRGDRAAAFRFVDRMHIEWERDWVNATADELLASPTMARRRWRRRSS
jgi:hypothetical protein